MVHQSIVPLQFNLNRSRDFAGEGETSGTGRMPDFWPWQSQTVRCSSTTAKVKLTVSVIIFLFLSPFVADYSRVLWARWGYANTKFLYRFCFLNERQNVFIIAVHYYFYLPSPPPPPPPPPHQCSVLSLKYWLDVKAPT